MLSEHSCMTSTAMRQHDSERLCPENKQQGTFSPSSLMARISALRQPLEWPKLNTAPPMRRPKPSAPPRRRSPSIPFSLQVHHPPL